MNHHLLFVGYIMLTIVAIGEALLLVTALSLDSLVSGFSYGSNHIRIPFRSIFLISLICCETLAIALYLGSFLQTWLPFETATAICFLLLLCLGMFRVFDSTIKAFIRRHHSFKKKLSFSAFHLRFILNVYANPEAADRDHSKHLSPSEAAFLAIALSFDGLAVGFGAGITAANPFLIPLFAFFADMLYLALGCFLGQRIAKQIPFDLSWLSGVLLIILALIKLP